MKTLKPKEPTTTCCGMLSCSCPISYMPGG
jgi:hypothetical protein